MTDLTAHILDITNRRPAEESLIVHTVGFAPIDGGLLAICPCGASCEVVGRDETAKSAIRAWMHDHTAGVR